ncbi:MAG: CehA/McbA family metallohydrolase [Terriglobia bacterium]
MKRQIALALLVVLLSADVVVAQTNWYRGNTHTHTINTSGEASPDVVVRWYKEHGYHFVVLTDHDSLTPVEGLNAVFAAPGKFLVLAGVEVSDSLERTPVHLNGIGVRQAVLPQGGASVADILNRDARAIRAAGGLPHVDHPNYRWALTADDIAAATEIRHFELWNAHPDAHNRGGGSPSTEELWDQVLSTGRLLYGVATDNAIYFYGEFSAARANPGRAWIVVQAAELTADAIVAALDRGDFYATTGVALKNYQADERGIRIELSEETGRNAPRYRTYFIGKDGMVLKRDVSLHPSYQFQGDELYVRARIEASTGALAWTQPVFVKNK